MIGSILINGAMGFGILIAILFGMGDIQTALASSTGFPVIGIFYHMTRGNAAAASAMTSTIIVSASLATVGLSAAATRTLWAFARDKGPPASNWLSQLNEKSRIPTNALILITAILALLGLLNIASTAAFGAILSLTVVALNLSYLFPVVAMLYRRIRTPSVLVWGPWRMSNAGGMIANIISICWITFVTVFLLLPAMKPVTALNMNYASAVLGGVLIFATIDWFVRGRKQYVGPLKHE
jgi:choline transport protein